MACNCRNEPSQERGARNDAAKFQVFIRAVIVSTYRSHAVQCWNTQSGDVVAIGRATGPDVLESEAKLGSNAMRKLDCVNRTQLVAKTIRLRLIE